MTFLLRALLSFAAGVIAFWFLFQIFDYFCRKALFALIKPNRKRVLGIERPSPLRTAGKLMIMMGTSFLIVFLVSRSPILGLVASSGCPPLLMAHQTFERWRAERELQSSSITALHTLKGLLKAGIGLPTALQRISSHKDNAFAAALVVVLNRYDRGQNLSECFEDLRRSSRLGAAEGILPLIVTSYRNGLPLLPLLDRSLEFLEARSKLAEATRNQLKAAVAQGAFALLMPWIVLTTLFFFEKEVVIHFFQSRLVWGLFFPVALESLGGFTLWQISRFY